MPNQTDVHQRTNARAASTRSNNRIFWTYWSAGAISQVGSAVTAVALPLVAVLALDASAFQVGLLAAATYAAWLVLGLPSGVIVQRLPLRGAQVAMDLIRAAALGSIPLAWWLGHLTMTHLVVVALVVSFANVIFDVGNLTFLPALVSKDELTARNSVMSGTHATTQVGGPSLGGLLVQLLGAVPTLLVDATSYLVSAVLMRRLPPRRVPRPQTEASMARMVRDGWRFVNGHPVMRPAMWDAAATNFVNGALHALVPVYLVRELGASALMVGLLIAADGVGTLLGAALTPRLSRRLGTARVMLWAGLGGALTALLMPVGAGWLGMLCFALGYGGFAVGVVVLSINTRTYRQTASPPELLSRVMATVRFVSWGAIPLGSVAAGALATVAGVREALLAACVLALTPLLILWFSPVRRLRDLDDHPEHASRLR